MKKLMMILAGLAVGNLVFAAKVSVSPVKVSYNQISTDASGNLQQTVIADNGMAITIGAELKDDVLKYNFSLDNITDPDYLMRQDCIKTYYGNFDTDTWIENTASAYSNTTTTSVSSSIPTDSITAAEACFIAGATCLCALTLAEICNATTSSSSKSSSSSSSRVSRTPSSSSRVPSVAPSRRTTVITPAPVFNWVIVDGGNSSSSSSTNRNYNSTTPSSLTSTVVTGSSYRGSFSVPAGSGPDYRVRFTVSKNEFIDFYFSRSDRDNVANPLKDRTYGRHSIMLSCGVPDYTRWGGYYIYSGKTVGAYGGFSYQQPNWLDSDIGYFAGTDSSNRVNLNDSYYFEKYYAKDPVFAYDSIINISGGLTIKTVPHTWLMLGCGLDIVDQHYFAEIVDSSDVFVQSGYICETEPILAAVPEVGINLILDHFDLSATYKYSFYNGSRFDLMIGIAF